MEAPRVLLCRPAASCAGDGVRFQVLLEPLVLLFEREQLLKLCISLHARLRCRMALLLDFSCPAGGGSADAQGGSVGGALGRMS